MLDKVSFDAALKTLYTDEKVEKLTYKDRPLLGLIPKNTKFYGKNHTYAVYYGNPQGRSAKFSQAQARAQTESSKTVDFIINRVSDYGVITIDNETMESSENDAGAFLKARETEIDGIYESMSDSLSLAIAGSGWGDIAVIGSISGATLTLATPNDVVAFEVGMELVVAAAQSTGNIRAVGSSGLGLVLTAVNRATGVLTFASNVTDTTNGIPTAAAGDFIFNRGDREEASSPTMKRMAGLQAWIPDTDPTSTPFFGVDRTKDVTRLGGIRKSVLGLPIGEALLDSAHFAYVSGTTFDHFVMSPQRQADLIKAEGSKVRYVDVMATPKIGYRGVVIVGPGGDIVCLADKTMKDTRTYGLSIDKLELFSLGKAPRTLNSDGLEMLRQATADAVECRVGYYAQLKNYAPGRHMVLTH